MEMLKAEACRPLLSSIYLLYRSGAPFDKTTGRDVVKTSGLYKTIFKASKKDIIGIGDYKF